MDNKKTLTMKEENKPTTVTPIAKTVNLIENNDDNSIVKILSMDIIDHDYDDNESAPLDFRRDWSNDLEDMNIESEKEGRLVSTELYAILQKTVATISPCDDFSDDDDDDSSYDSLPINISSNVFNDPPADVHVDCKNIHLLKRLYHDRSQTMVETTEPFKRKKLN